MSRAHGGQLVPAGDLQPGDRIVESRTGVVATVQRIDVEDDGRLRVTLGQVWCVSFTVDRNEPVWRRPT